MIVFVTDEEHHYTLTTVLETRDHALHGRVTMLGYRQFLSLPKLPRGDYVFVDLERLSPDHLAAGARRLALLQAAFPAMRVLNPPSEAMTRIAVMRRLHRPGLNRFRVMPADDLAPDLRFPVFLRRLDNHDGPTGALIHDHATLEAEIARQGGDLAVTEYVDARNDLGAHEKRSYFRIGDRFYPSAMDASTNWVCKGVVGEAGLVDIADRERAFLAGNEDACAMRMAFDAAGIGYGRADYAIVDGAPQVFEINTNPMIENPEAMPEAFRDYSRTVLAKWLAAMEAFSGADRGHAPRWVAVGGAIAAPAAPQTNRLRRTIRAVLFAMGQAHRETKAMRFLRGIGVMY